MVESIPSGTSIGCWLKFLWAHVFLVDTNVMFCLKKYCKAGSRTMYGTTWDRIDNFWITLEVLLSLRYLCIPTWIEWWKRVTLVIYIDDWFCENDSFRKLFLFFESNVHYLRGISQDILVSHFDSRTSLSSVNRRRSISPIFLVSFTQPCDQQDRKIRTICKSAAWWRGRRAWGYRKSILRANLLYVPNIKM